MESINQRRTLIRNALANKRRRREPIVGAGAGTGLSAKCEEAGGVDLIVLYNSGRFRMAGHGSLAGLLAFGNANDIVMEMGREILSVVRSTPVLAGVNATDPFLDTEQFLDGLIRCGFAGVQNFPTVGLIDGQFRLNLEETGMGYDREITLIGAAADAGLLTTPYVFGEEDAARMTEAGADVVVCHLGVTSGGTIGAKTVVDWDAATEQLTSWTRAARAVRPDVIVLCHGGPLAEPEDIQIALERVPELDGFYGASSMERLPVERAIVSQIKAFRAVTLGAQGAGGV